MRRTAGGTGARDSKGLVIKEEISGKAQILSVKEHFQVTRNLDARLSHCL